MAEWMEAVSATAAQVSSPCCFYSHGVVMNNDFLYQVYTDIQTDVKMIIE